MSAATDVLRAEYGKSESHHRRASRFTRNISRPVLREDDGGSNLARDRQSQLCWTIHATCLLAAYESPCTLGSDRQSPFTSHRESAMKKFFKTSPSQTIALSFMTLSAVAAQAYAGTITVCPDGSCNFTDPVAAIAAAAPGDIIEIHAGTYMLSSFIPIVGGVAGKPLVIRGAVDASGKPTTVLNAGGTKKVFELVGLDATTSFENLVITNGRGDYGGAVFTYGANVVFRNCAFRSNRANGLGGAIFLNDSDPLLIDCEFTDNVASNPQGAPQAGGGAIYVGNNTLTLTRCSFTANASNYYGGALFVTGGSNPGRVNLQSTRICGNTAPNGPQIGMSAGAIINMDAYSCVSNACKNCTVAPPCPTDFNLDRVVNAVDLSVMLSAWGSCKSNCPSDLNADGVVNAVDLSEMLSTWGACPN
ncbi:MAG: right-handed parallel beta-helix repeat-containing protein [Planctomycetota bacterium]